MHSLVLEWGVISRPSISTITSAEPEPETKQQVDPYPSGEVIRDAMEQEVGNAIARELPTTEYHMPLHNYMGPGTHVLTNLVNNTLPTTIFDKASMIHDVEYVKPGNQWRADNNMWLNLVKEAPYLMPIHNMIRAAFLVKDLGGYKPETSEALYSLSKSKVQEGYGLNHMTFADSEYGVWGL